MKRFNHSLKLLAALATWTLLSIAAHASALNQAPTASKQASVDVAWSKQPDGDVRFDFKTTPAKDLKINNEGPWSLEIKAHSGLTIAKSKLGKSDFQEKLPGFSLMAKPTAKSGKIDFKMVVFVCTASKGQCFRDVQQGSLDWKLN
jgi:hypothetical protein